jgi:hypothetical protein
MTLPLPSSTPPQGTFRASRHPPRRSLLRCCLAAWLQPLPPLQPLRVHRPTCTAALRMCRTARQATNRRPAATTWPRWWAGGWWCTAASRAASAWVTRGRWTRPRGTGSACTPWCAAADSFGSGHRGRLSRWPSMAQEGRVGGRPARAAGAAADTRTVRKLPRWCAPQGPAPSPRRGHAGEVVDDRYLVVTGARPQRAPCFRTADLTARAWIAHSRTQAPVLPAALVRTPPAPRHHCSTTAVPLQYHCSTTAVPLQYHCSTTAVPLQYHCHRRAVRNPVTQLRRDPASCSLTTSRLPPCLFAAPRPPGGFDGATYLSDGGVLDLRTAAWSRLDAAGDSRHRTAQPALPPRQRPASPATPPGSLPYLSAASPVSLVSAS